MPITAPNLDNRRFQDLRDDALARIPVHTPEWTNFNRSDPGVTLVEVFAFLTENLLYRANQIPERNRLKFLQLLGVRLQPASAARGLVTIDNPKGDLLAQVLNAGLEVRAGTTPFQTSDGLEVLPIEARFFYKKSIAQPSSQTLDYYQQLYASYRGSPAPLVPQLYSAAPFCLPGAGPISLADSIDGAVWVALLVREGDKPAANFLDVAREAIGGRTLSLGVVPYLPQSGIALPPGRSAGAVSNVKLEVAIPSLPPSGGLEDSDNRTPHYKTLDTSVVTDVFTQPGVVEIHLPSKSELMLWNNIDPLESGVNGLPPTLDDTAIADRLITWLRLRPVPATPAQFFWIGINAVTISQRARITGEQLLDGTGEPDQVVTLSRSPILPATVRLTATTPTGDVQLWQEIEDLGIAGPEVNVPDLRLPPGTEPDVSGPSQVFSVDAEAGTMLFGDGLHGARPQEGATLRADYEYSLGNRGNVGPGSISVGPALPSGFKVANPVATWGGADAETTDEGQKQVSRYLQHRDRLVTAADFETVTLRTPGVEIGRVEVLPTYNPQLNGQGGDAAGAVTLMVIPAYDANQPEAPVPDREFLNTICTYLDTRRLVTTEIFLRGPDYVGIWISVGIDAVPGINDGPVREAVKNAITRFLAPTAGGTEQLPDDPVGLLMAPSAQTTDGWALRKTVNTLELAAVTSRVPGVELVRPVLLAADDGVAVAAIAMTGLQLPRILGIRVSNGDPARLEDLRGAPAGTTGTAATVVQVPLIPAECT
jgi:hypothetical protein